MLLRRTRWSFRGSGKNTRTERSRMLTRRMSYLSHYVIMTHSHFDT
jgi:hypothetical protein